MRKGGNTGYFVQELEIFLKYTLFLFYFTNFSNHDFCLVLFLSKSSCDRFLFRPVDRDVFVRDLDRQLETPSPWLPVDSCKKEDKEAP